MSTQNNVKYIKTTKSNMNKMVPIVAGQLIYTTDTCETYWDINSTERKYLGDIIILETEVERESILAPIDKFYFIKESEEIYRYTVSAGWVRLTNKTRTIDCGGP